MADGAPVPPTGDRAVPPQGTPPFDPTQNVLNLVTAAIQRQDDLRVLQAEHERYIAELRASYEDKLRSAHDDKAALRAGYNDKLREAESARIDAIRLVDVATQQRAAEVLATQQQALAEQVRASAEALRIAAEAAARSTAETLRTTFVPVQTRLDELSRAQYETQGQKSQVVETRSVRAGAQLSAGTIMGAVSVALVLIFGIIGIFLAAHH